jgi:hypothetical protein
LGTHTRSQRSAHSCCPFQLGFFATHYVRRFLTIHLFVAIHATSFILLLMWVEVHVQWQAMDIVVSR